MWYLSIPFRALSISNRLKSQRSLGTINKFSPENKKIADISIVQIDNSLLFLHFFFCNVEVIAS